MACLDNIIEINKSDCIGNSRETINENFSVVKDKICSLDIEQKTTESKTIFDVPLYGIIMYYGDITPGGTDFLSSGRGKPEKNLQAFAICDGRNGTPNMQDRFVVGAGRNYEQRTFGPGDNVSYTNDTLSLEFSSVRLSVSEMPTHKHTITEPTAAGGQRGHRHAPGTPAQGDGFVTKLIDNNATLGAGPLPEPRDLARSGHWEKVFHTDYSTTGIIIDNEGGSTKHENRPPYIALGYIMRVPLT